MCIPSVLMEGSVVYPSYDRFAQIIERHNVTILKCGSTFLRQMMVNKQTFTYDVSSLKIGSFCAEPVNNEVLCFAQDKLCSNFINSYWATEHGGIVWIVYDSQHIQKTLLPTTHNYPLPWIDACIQVRDKDKNLGDVVIQKPYPYLFYTVWGRPIELYSCRLDWR